MPELLSPPRLTQRSADDSIGSAPGAHRWFIALAALGLAAHVALWAVSFGSSDVQLWEVVGRRVAHEGLFAAYEKEVDANQPPGQVLWAGLSYRFGGKLGLGFARMWKAPMVLSDFVVCWVLWQVLRPRRGKTPASLSCALYAWSPPALLISAHHGNGDSVYAMFALLAVYLIEDRESDFWGGLALGAGINVKLVPVLLIAPLIAAYRTRQRLMRFMAGLAAMAVPSIIALIGAPAGFYRRVLGYNSMVELWGVNKFLLDMLHEPRTSAMAQPMVEAYHERGKYFIIGAIVLLSFWGRRRMKGLSRDGLGRYRLAACAMAFFLILAPGFGVQYLVAVLPLLFVVDLGRAVLYSVLSAMVLLFTYWPMYHGGIPIETFGEGNAHGPSPGWALLTWAMLVNFVWSTMRSFHQRDMHSTAA